MLVSARVRASAKDMCLWTQQSHSVLSCMQAVRSPHECKCQRDSSQKTCIYYHSWHEEMLRAICAPRLLPAGRRLLAIIAADCVCQTCAALAGPCTCMHVLCHLCSTDAWSLLFILRMLLAASWIFCAGQIPAGRSCTWAGSRAEGAGIKIPW